MLLALSAIFVKHMWRQCKRWISASTLLAQLAISFCVCIVPHNMYCDLPTMKSSSILICGCAILLVYFGNRVLNWKVWK